MDYVLLQIIAGVVIYFVIASVVKAFADKFKPPENEKDNEAHLMIAIFWIFILIFLIVLVIVWLGNEFFKLPYKGTAWILNKIFKDK